MTELKCPFCQQELVEIQFGEQRYWTCINDKCNESVGFGGNLKLWQALIDTKKKIDIAVDFIKKIDGIRSCVKQDLYAHNKSLNSGIVFCWTTPDEIHNIIEQIKDKE